MTNVTTMTAVTLIDQASAKVFTMHDAIFTGLAAPSRGSTENSAWIVELTSDRPGVPHQLNREEIFICLQGSAMVQMGDQQIQLTTGACLVIPAHTQFSLSKTSEEPFKAVAILPVGGQARLANGESFIPPWAL